MTYDDRRPDVLHIDQPRPAGASPRQARWSWAVAAALILGLGLVFYGIDMSRNGPKTAKPPAVTASPAPAAGVAPPAPETTTGQAAPPAAAETAGRGSASSGAPR
jgi:hypothetical protein